MTDQVRHQCFRSSLLAALLISIAVSALAQTPSTAKWLATGTLAAPEAHQAAAADEQLVYAIASTKVAKYDRQSGKLAAISTGDAKHLNSGFFWQGRLYCAHSNYPQTPEQSQIKVLDVETMRLSTFKDFGNFGGSLTWAVQHDSHWWCNFARYGANNSETFLVKFEVTSSGEWKELTRWTYPAAVINQIGQMSISGGLWRDGSIVVTDHDNPRLYELRLPKAGTVLELVTHHAAPFTGQGIAIDPKTGGLVGINRARRQVVFATEEQSDPPRPR